MKLTTAQIFMIGNAVFGALTGAGGASLLAAYHLSPNVVTTITLTAGVILGIWNVIGTIMTGQEAQLTAVLANKDQPKTQTALVAAVANYPGLEPLQINANATPALVALAADTSVPKVLVPKS